MPLTFHKTTTGLHMKARCSEHVEKFLLKLNRPSTIHLTIIIDDPSKKIIFFRFIYRFVIDNWLPYLGFCFKNSFFSVITHFWNGLQLHNRGQRSNSNIICLLPACTIIHGNCFFRTDRENVMLKILCQPLNKFLF